MNSDISGSDEYSDWSASQASCFQAIMYTEVWTAGLSGDFSGTALNVIPGNEVAWASSEIGGDCYYSGGLCSGGHNPGNYLPGKNIFTRPSEDWFRR